MNSAPALQRPGRRVGLRATPTLLALLTLAASAAVVFEAQRVFRADWASMAQRQQVVSWLSAEVPVFSAEDWDRAQAALQHSLALTPDDPSLHEGMGDLHSVAGRRDWADAAMRHAHFRRAAQSYETALRLRPVEPGAWAALASARQSYEAPPELVQQAWTKALALGPYEGHVQLVLLQVALADWDRATPAMHEWAKQLFDKGDSAKRAQINAKARYYGLLFSADAP